MVGREEVLGTCGSREASCLIIHLGNLGKPQPSDLSVFLLRSSFLSYKENSVVAVADVSWDLHGLHPSSVLVPSSKARSPEHSVLVPSSDALCSERSILPPPRARGFLC